jgi:hypothetical protein
MGELETLWLVFYKKQQFCVFIITRNLPILEFLRPSGYCYAECLNSSFFPS